MLPMLVMVYCWIAKELKTNSKVSGSPTKWWAKDGTSESYPSYQKLQDPNIIETYTGEAGKCQYLGKTTCGHTTNTTDDENDKVF